MRFFMRLSVNIFAVIVFLFPLQGLGQSEFKENLDKYELNRESGDGSNGSPFIIPETSEKLRIDAILDEPAWANAFTTRLEYEVRPGENIPAPVATQVFLTFDDEKLYAAFICEDNNPEQIRAFLSDRDRIHHDDWVGIVLDTFNDQRRSFMLRVNPLGVQEDFIESQSGTSSWDAIWESAGQITKTGYQVEFAVPFNQLRFQRTGQVQVWGFDAERNYPRSNEHRIGLFPRDRNENCYLCQALKIQGFKDVSPGKNIEIIPTLTGIRTDERDTMPSGNFDTITENIEFGVTGRWSFTPNLTLSSTYNPDFNQVEADALQLDINQPFALYYSERRPFFTEGSDFFNTLKDAVHTRTIRQPTWGAKISGKEGKHTIGCFVAQDTLTNLVFPGSQWSNSTTLEQKSTASVLRYKYDLGSRYTIGAMLTDREGDDYYNRVAGIDTDFRVTRTNQFQLQVLRSSTSYPEQVISDFAQPGDSFDDYYVAFEYDRYSRTEGWWFDYDYVGDDFRADLGYIPRVGFRNYEGGFLKFWNPDQDDWFSNMYAGLEVNYFEDISGMPLDRGFSVYHYYSGFAQSWTYFRYYQYLENYNGEEFNLSSFSAEGGIRPNANTRMNLYLFFGDRIDYSNTREGERFRISPYFTARIGRHLYVTFDYGYEHLDVEAGRLFTVNTQEFSAVYQFNIRMFFRAIVQHSVYNRTPDLYTFDIDRKYQGLFTQFLFSYKINPPTVLFLGYSDNSMGTTEYELTQANRTVFMKLGYSWSL